MKFNSKIMDKRFVQIGGVVVMLLLGIVGYFVQRLVTSTDNLNESVQQLRITVERNQTENKGMFTLFDMRLSELERRVRCNEDKLQK